MLWSAFLDDLTSGNETELDSPGERVRVEDLDLELITHTV